MDLKKYIENRSIFDLILVIVAMIVPAIVIGCCVDSLACQIILYLLVVLFLLSSACCFIVAEEKSKLKQELDTLRKKFNHNYNVAKSLETANAKKNQQIQSIRDDYSKLKETFDKNYRIAKHLEEKNASLQKSNSDLQRYNFELATERIDLQDKVRRLEIEKHNFRGRRVELSRLRKFEARFKGSSGVKKVLLCLRQLTKETPLHVNLILIQEMLHELEQQNVLA